MLAREKKSRPDRLKRYHGCLQVNTVVLDKTGTLTEGRLRLIGAVPSAVPTAVSGDHAEASTAHADGPAGRDTAALLRVACAVESGTRHPLADAVLAAARDAGIDPAECTASDVRTVPGEGACGVVDGRLAAIGRPEWVLRQIGPLTLTPSPSSLPYFFIIIFFLRLS